jgi:eukaryotic-like serine/threonine-protein kinase
MKLHELDRVEFAALDGLLAAALEQPEGSRESWLRSQCAGFPRRLQHALELLRRTDSVPAWEHGLERSQQRAWIAEGGDDSAGFEAPPPDHCGAWRLLHRIGRGGMADVFLGERHEAGFVQRAAIKLLHSDANSKETFARFEQERRILATLDDPRIARLLDGGVCDDGRPWLAMEHVVGERIDAWCDAHRLELGARLRLLREVAAAAHSAHRALVVHRDIKPANVMVTADGHVKLLDFGIAKLLAAEPADDIAAAATRTQSRVLTPQYASPEQLLGGNITTATDVYQLGLLMVELLTGVRPHRARADNLVDLAHAVVNEDVPAPSQLLAHSGLDAERCEALLLARRTTAPRLKRQLRGDLDAIAQRAMARSPAQRYPSALQFVDDLDAYLAQRPVRARAPSLGYRLRRFALRNWWASAVGAVLVLVLVAYVGTVALQSGRIRREAELNRQVRDYLAELLREADPLHSGTPQPSAEQVLEQGLVNARERFAAQPDLLAEILEIGADVKVRHGDYVRGAALISEALALKRRGDPDDPRLTVVLARHGQSLHYTARYLEAESALREAEGRWYAQGAAGTAWIPMSLADVLHSRGEYAAAESVLRRADAAQRRSGASALAHAELARDLGVVLRDAGRMAEARALIAGALAQMQRLVGDEHGSTAVTRVAFARTLALNGEAASARGQAEAAMATQARYYGGNNAVVGITRHTLAVADEFDGALASAARILDQVIDHDYAAVAAGNVLPAYAHLDRAWVRLASGEDAGARQDLDAAEPTLRDIRAGGHPRWAELLLARAAIAVRSGDHEGARAAIARAIALRAESFGRDHPLTRDTQRWHALVDGSALRSATPGASALEARRLQRVAAPLFD